MIQPKFLGRHPVTNRSVYLLSLETLDTPHTWPESANPHCVCLTAFDSTTATVAELSDLCERLLQLDCAYFCTWGPGCERVHDIMDELVVGYNPPESYRGCVMTTWHTDESLEEALDFFLDDTYPDEEFAPNGCAFGMVITIGSRIHDEAIEQYIATRLSLPDDG